MIYDSAPATGRFKSIVVPPVLAVRVGGLEPLIRKWMRRHPNVRLSHLMICGLKKELKPFAGKRYAHLIRD